MCGILLRVLQKGLHFLGGCKNVERLQMRQDLKNLRRDNQRLTEANSTLERRVAGGRTNASSDQLWRYKEEVRLVWLSFIRMKAVVLQSGNCHHSSQARLAPTIRQA